MRRLSMWECWVLAWCGGMAALAISAVFPGLEVLSHWWWKRSTSEGQKIVEWMQAIGTLGAVWVALWTPYRMRRDQDDAAAKRTVKDLQLFSAHLLYVCDLVIKEEDAGSAPFARHRATLYEALRMGREIELTPVNADWTVAAISLRGHAAEMLAQLDVTLRSWRRKHVVTAGITVSVQEGVPFLELGFTKSLFAEYRKQIEVIWRKFGEEDGWR